MHELVESWFTHKEGNTQGFTWLRSRRPPQTAANDGASILQGHIGHVTSVAASPTGKWLATGSRDGSVRIRDGSAGQLFFLREWGADVPVLSVCWSPDGMHLVCGCGDRTIRVWDVHGGEEVELLGQMGFVDDVSCSQHDPVAEV